MFSQGRRHRRGISSWLLAVSIALAGTAVAATPSNEAQVRATSGDEALDNAVAAVVVAALGEQFTGTESISMRLDTIDVRISSVRERLVSGEGRMRLGDDPEWIGFRYRTLYDTTFANAGYPELTLGGVDAGEREIPNDASLVRQLDENVVAELDRTLGGGARLQLDRIATVEAGRRFLRISASGVADFGMRGITPIRIESLYDTGKSAWQRVQYDLGVPAGNP